MKIAVLGYGDMGRLHLAMYKELPGAEVAYIFGRNKDKVSKIAKKFGVNYTANPQEIYNDKSIVGVDVCVPSANHHEYIISSLKAGKHVFCETPISFDLKEAKEMIETARKYNRIFLVATLMPFVDEIRYVVEQINSGKFGKPLSIQAYRQHKLYSKTDPIIELATFEIDTVIRILGVPTKVSAKNDRLKKAKQTTATLNYGSASADIEIGDVLQKGTDLSHGIKIVCVGGIVEAKIDFTKPELGPPQTTIVVCPTNGDREEIKVEKHFPYKEECRYFLDCINGTADPDYLSAGKAYDGLKVATAIKKSISLKQEVNIDSVST